jgi:hypothetical protein
MREGSCGVCGDDSGAGVVARDDQVATGQVAPLPMPDNRLI